MPPSGRHWLVARPECVRLAGDASDRTANIFAATVSDIVYQGDSFICYAALANGEQIALRDYCRSDILSRIPQVGQSINLQINAEDASIVTSEA